MCFSSSDDGIKETLLLSPFSCRSVVKDLPRMCIMGNEMMTDEQEANMRGYFVCSSFCSTIPFIYFSPSPPIAFSTRLGIKCLDTIIIASRLITREDTCAQINRGRSLLSAIVIISERCPVEEFQRSISPSPSPQLSRVLTPPFHMLPRRCRTGSCTVDRPQRAVRESYLLLHCSPHPLLQPFSCSVCSVFALGFTS